MQIYLWVILFSVLFAHIADKFRHQKVLFFTFSACSLLILTIFAGCRDLTVGFDVMFYEYSIFQSACYSSSFIELLNSDVSSIEPFFLFVNYIAVQVFANIHFVLGVISFITILFAYMACWQYRKHAPFWLLYGMYLLLTYNSSLNIMRQYMAISIILYAYTIMKDKGINRQFLFFSILAVMTHYSAIFPASIFCVYNFIPIMNKKTYNLFIFGSIIVSVTLLPMMNTILSYSSQFIGKDYSFYLDKSASNADWAESTISGSRIGLIVLYLLICIYGLKKKTLSKTDWKEYLCTIFISVFCFWMGATFMASTLRLFNYFQMLSCFNLCNISLAIPSTRNGRNIAILLLVCLFTILSIRFMYNEYTSKILSI